MVGRIMDETLKKVWEEAGMVKLRYCPGICLEKLMKTKTPCSLPTLIADGTTAEVQTRYPNASLEHHHFINPFGTFSVCITDDLLAYHNIHFSLNIVVSVVSILLYIFWRSVLTSNMAVTKEEIHISKRIITKVLDI
jgi:competence protein ComGC